MDMMNNSEYQYISTLGSGAYGVVTKVSHKETGQEYARKKVCFDDFDNLNELDVLSRFNHPNIIKLVQYYFEVTNLYLVLPLGDCTLKEYSEKSKIHLSDKVEMMWKLLSAIHFMHQSGYTHNDIKPANIMMFKSDDITRDGVFDPVLIDFGLALPDGTEQDYSGTPYTASPQGLDSCYIDCSPRISKKIDKIFREKCNFKQADIFSLGVVFYYIISEGGNLVSDQKTSEKLIPEYISFIKNYEDRLFKIQATLKSKHYIKLFNDLKTQDTSEFHEKLSKTYFMIDNFMDLLKKMTAPSQEDRMKDITEVVNHPFFQEDHREVIPGTVKEIECNHFFDEDVVNSLIEYKKIFTAKTLSIAYSIYLRCFELQKETKVPLIKYCVYLANTLSEIKCDIYDCDRIILKGIKIEDATYSFKILIKIVEHLRGQIRCSNEVQISF